MKEKIEIPAIGDAVLKLLKGWERIPKDPDESTYNEENLIKIHSLKHPVHIHLEFNGYRAKNRLRIAGWLDQPWSGRVHAFYFKDGERPSDITVAEDSTPEKIVAAINRRLLPGLLDFLGRVKELVAKDDNFKNKLLSDTKDLADTVGYTITQRDIDEIHRGQSNFRMYGLNSLYTEVKVMSGDADIKISNLPFKVAKEVLRLLAKYQKPSEVKATVTRELAEAMGMKEVPGLLEFTDEKEVA